MTFKRLGKILQTGSAFHLLCSTGWSLTVVLWVANTPSWSMDLAEVNEELSGLCIRKHSRLAGRARRLCPGPEGARTSSSCQNPANLTVTQEPQHKLLIPSLFLAVSKPSCPAHIFSCPLWTDPDPRSREGSRWFTATSPVRGRQQVTSPSQNCDRLFPRTSCFPGCWASLPGRTLDKAFGSLSFSSLIKYLQIHLLPNDIGRAPGNFWRKKIIEMKRINKSV